MRFIHKGGLVALMAFGPLAIVSGNLSAQEQQGQEGITQCTATVSSDMMGGIQSGQKATQLSLTLTSPVGQIDDFEAEKVGGDDPMSTTTTEQQQTGIDQENGDDLKLADAADLPATQTEMSTSGEQENEVIQMSNQSNSVTLWLNTEDAGEGNYRFTLKGEQGDCTGQLQVTGRGYDR